MSIRLVINNADGSHYWTEHFPDRESADKWFAEEQTRPYWDKARSAEFIDNSPPPPSAEEIAAAAVEIQKREQAQASVESIDWDQVKSLEELTAIVRALVERG